MSDETRPSQLPHKELFGWELHLDLDEQWIRAPCHPIQ